MAVKKAVTRSQEFSDSVIDTVREPLIILDQDLRVVTASRSFYEFFKVTPDETEGQLIYNLGNDQWDIPKLRELLETILPEKTTFDNYEVEHDFATIGKRIMLLNARQIKRALGKERIILLAIEDITERKRLENLLTESEERYRHLFETASDGIVLLEKNEGKITHANPATEKMLGYTNKDSIGNSLQDIGISLNMQDFPTTLHNLNKRGILHYDDVPVITKSGRHIDTDIYLVDRAKLVQCNIRDITERKQAEEELRDSEEFSRRLIESSLDCIKVLDLDGNLLSMSVGGQKILEIDDINIYLNKSWVDFWKGKDRENALEAISKAKKGDAGIFSGYCETEKGTPKWWEIIVTPIRDSQGYVDRLLSISRDVTKRKATEEALRKSEGLLRSLFENMTSCAAIYDVINDGSKGSDYIIRDFNVTSLRIEGKRKDEVIGKSLFDLRPNIDQYGLIPIFQNVWRTGESGYFPSTIYIDEEYSNWYENKVFKLPTGEIVAIYDDVTERKLAEEALRESEDRFRLLSEAAFEAIAIHDEGVLLQANDQYFKMFGYGPGEALGKEMMSLTIAPESIEFAKKQVATNSLEPYEMIGLRKDGTRFPIEIHIRKMEYKGCNVRFGAILDITERKYAEAELKKNEARLHSLLNATPFPIALVDTNDNNILFWSRSALTLFGHTAPTTPEWYQMAYPDTDYRREVIDRWKTFLETTHESGQTVNTGEYRITCSDGSVRICELYATFLEDNLVVTFNNITERKQAEDELRTSHLQLRALYTQLQQIREEERIRIAREIHDEMGGGLTGLKMDISWLSRKIDDAGLGEERVALIDRIKRSNMLIDQMIHVVRRVSTDLRPSILDDLGLVAALEWQLSEFTNRTEIQHEFATTFEYVNMGKEISTAVFRIFQEALTNVARHSRATKVAVVLREGERSLCGDEILVLEMRDNGRGITDEEILNPQSLGLLGMKERVLAFGGELSIRGESGGGTTMILQIPPIQGESS